MGEFTPAPAGGASFSLLLTAAGIIQLFILMDCNPKGFMFMKHK